MTGEHDDHKQDEKRPGMNPVLSVALVLSVSFILISAAAFTAGPAFLGNRFNLGRKGPAERPMNGAADYYQRGVEYKQFGWTEKAREDLEKAVAMDPSGEMGQRALRFLHTKLPANPIGRDAEQRNIEGYNLMVSDQKEQAKKVFARLIEDYPRFEWPYNNLAGIYVDENNAQKAEQLCRQALEINPHYTNARTTWAQAKIVARDFPGAQAQLDLALKEDPDDHWANMLKERLDLLKPGAKIPD